MKEQMEVLIKQMMSAGFVYEDAVRGFKRAWIEQTLKSTKGNNCRSAILLGMHRNTLSRTRAKLHIELKEARKSA